jgi:hypothetical protein
MPWYQCSPLKKPTVVLFASCEAQACYILVKRGIEDPLPYLAQQPESFQLKAAITVTSADPNYPMTDLHALLQELADDLHPLVDMEEGENLDPLVLPHAIERHGDWGTARLTITSED